jgi:predicted amidophosphoribosyltransferase
MWQFFLDFLFPRRSLTGGEGEWIMEEERRRLVSHPVIEDAEVLRKRGLTSLDRLVAASTYAKCPLLKKAIHTFKYGRVRGLDRELGRLIARAAPAGGPEHRVLCPVPLHWLRRFGRGFNQAECLARVVAAERGLPVRGLLMRICRIPDPPAHLVLIDDLSTTGATLDACARALKEAGARYVEGWVIAHG